MKIIKIASKADLISNFLGSLKAGFEKVRRNREEYPPSLSMLFSDNWVETTGQKPIDHWGGNFYSMLSIYKKFLDRGKEERAAKHLQGMLDLNICDQNHEYWLSEFDKIFGTDLLNQWKIIIQ